MSSKYEDIMNHPVHEPDPVRHPRMSRGARAAQFASFAALTGYSELVEETGDRVCEEVMNETVFEEIEDI
ncbi:MAG: hypothetical protein K5871_12210 [Lachnospiraceae bacterium]|nr:hypothetical protein [Lachnospiraceae bacterium]